MELYYALNAYKRLDQNAESYCRDIDGTYPCKANPQEDDLNGFFIRDDVPYTTFAENTPSPPSIPWGTPLPTSHFNRPGIINTPLAQRDPYVNGSFSGRTNIPRAPSISWPYSDTRMPTEESADQTVQLAMGFSLAAKLANNVYYAGIHLGGGRRAPS